MKICQVPKEDQVPSSLCPSPFAHGDSTGTVPGFSKKLTAQLEFSCTHTGWSLQALPVLGHPDTAWSLFTSGLVPIRSTPV